MSRILIDSIRCKGAAAALPRVRRTSSSSPTNSTTVATPTSTSTATVETAPVATLCAVVCPDQGIEVWNFKEKQTFVNTAGLTENMSHCPGCTHGVVHRLVAEVLEELDLLDRAVGIAPVGCPCWLCDTSTSICSRPRTAGRRPWRRAARARLELIVFTYQGDGDRPPLAATKSFTRRTVARRSRSSSSTTRSMG